MRQQRVNETLVALIMRDNFSLTREEAIGIAHLFPDYKQKKEVARIRITTAAPSSGDFHVYILKIDNARLSQERWIVKIGYTRNVRDRFKALQIGSPLPLIPVLLAQVGSKEIARSIEQRMHAIADHRGCRMFGEWFMLKSDVIDCISAELNEAGARILPEQQFQSNLLHSAQRFWHIVEGRNL